MSHPLLLSAIFEKLVEQGLIDTETAAQVLGTASASVPMLGTILVEARLLRVGDVMKILGAQADKPKLRFGELAVWMGFCDESDVQWALAQQRDLSRHPLEELVAQDVIPAPALLQFLIDCLKAADSSWHRMAA